MRYTAVSGVLNRCFAIRYERGERKLICLIFRSWYHVACMHNCATFFLVKNYLLLGV
jgi:hypothetical protein